MEQENLHQQPEKTHLSDTDLLAWAEGRTDCVIKKIKLSRETAVEVWFNGKLIFIGTK